jgi:ATP-dependent Clp protease ATP-binding subunit ClpB
VSLTSLRFSFVDLLDGFINNKRKWSKEKAQLESEKKAGEKLEQARHELFRAQKKGDYARASELQYGVIPELEKKMKDRENREGQKCMNFYTYIVIFI